MSRILWVDEMLWNKLLESDYVICFWGVKLIDVWLLVKILGFSN